MEALYSAKKKRVLKLKRTHFNFDWKFSNAEFSHSDINWKNEASGFLTRCERGKVVLFAESRNMQRSPRISCSHILTKFVIKREDYFLKVATVSCVKGNAVGWAEM